ncbi:hypothetical protein L2E82_09201 [Cichorium intybus]|uniref:Uncharacterized protein n=1 Tax=Cichorium intybus TaxID=13427 RepID=A0ACB9G8V7_CICIN|nr:hypothetical protein L2E82_09201 [Cichorium intybus]
MRQFQNGKEEPVSWRLDSRVVSERGVEKRLVNGDGGAADLCVGEVSSLCWRGLAFRMMKKLVTAREKDT